MKDTLVDIERWLDAGKRFAVATVVDTWRSAPRMTGSTMLISENLEVVGSVSGGCVEGSVIKQAQESLSSNEAKLLMFGISNDDAWSVGLSCGGKIKVFVEPFLGQKRDGESQALWNEVVSHLADDRPFALVHKIDEAAAKFFYDPTKPEEFGLSPALSKKVADALMSRESKLIALDQIPYFLQVFPPQNHLIIIGAAHLSVDLVALAHQFDFRTTVIDPRGIFTDSLRELCRPDELIKAWPADVLQDMILDDNVFTVSLTHDPKIDDQALSIFLKENVRYIGALGSRKTHEKRMNRLAKAGFTDSQIAKIKGPIGLSINARSAREIALSIVGQLIEYRHKSTSRQNQV